MSPEMLEVLAKHQEHLREALEVARKRTDTVCRVQVRNIAEIHRGEFLTDSEIEEFEPI